MCGIAGIVDLALQRPADRQVLQRMCWSLVHRGPDEEGAYVDGPVALGIRRLSIIDVAGGQQPIHNEERSIWVVLNGEIYNFPDLRAELEKSGHRFSTHSDTEVIAHLYEEKGAECVRTLRGMFAFALYDERQKRLLLARDRLGKKPLYYAIHNGQLLFGSEIKALLAAAPELAQVSQESVLSYFCFGYIPDPLTAFVPIRKLPPGHYLELADGKVQLHPYWDLPPYSDSSPSSEEDALQELEERLTEAVRIRLISEVPLGALLSGGVDSSTVVALMRRTSSGPVKTFSIAFRHADFNEAEYARAVARAFETEHHEMIVDPDIWGTLDALTRSLEEPLADSTVVPQFHLSRMARQHVTVALAGDGGDELFAGYERYHTHLRRNWANAIPHWLGRAHRSLIDPLLPAGFPGRRLLFNLSLPERDRFLDSVSFFPNGAKDHSLFSDDFQAATAKFASPYERFRQYYDHAPAADPLSRLLYLDTKTNLPGDILTKADRMSMAVSLELRAPLLDHVVAEWAA
ncbi:MAG: asparagine synthase (glutamine-hydrolyzing), partial [Candidatus Acidiferrales bacterium]